MTVVRHSSMGMVAKACSSGLGTATLALGLILMQA